MVLLSPRLAIALPDQRAERTIAQVMSSEAHLELLLRLSKLPPSVKHLVLVATVPMVFPHILGTHSLLKFFRAASRHPVLSAVMHATGIFKLIISHVSRVC